VICPVLYVSYDVINIFRCVYINDDNFFFGRSYHNADNQPTIMERRDYSYYETHAADINLEEITSSAKNANTRSGFATAMTMTNEATSIWAEEYSASISILETKTIWDGWVISLAKMNAFITSILITCPTEKRDTPSWKVSPAVNQFERSTYILSTKMDSLQF